MGARGPLPKSLKLHQMEGTRARSKTGDGLKLPVERPEPPALLTAGGTVEFERLCSQLESAGILAMMDGDLLAVLANAISEYTEIGKEIAKLSVADAIAAGLIKYRDRASATIARLSKEFGLSPVSRQRLKGPDRQEEAASRVATRKRV
jgi:P27 family predicted phage terminase small subunit